MILNKQILMGSAVNAELQKMMRVVTHHDPAVSPEHRASRYKSVVDSRGRECGVVTRQYRLVKNGDLIGAIDLATDRLGVDVTATQGVYRNGRFKASFTLPDAFNVPGDPSESKPYLNIGNGYGGGHALTGDVGIYRLVCTNGMVIGQRVRADYQKHVGNFDLMQFVEKLVTAIIDRAEAAKIIAETTAQIGFDMADENNRNLIVEMADDTPRKYLHPLRRAISTNRHDMGSTAWAILQAISEVSTHHMVGWAAEDWQRRQTERLLEHVGVTV